MLGRSATPLPDVFVLEPDYFEDHRGFFYESWNQAELESVTGPFVQDNHSGSKRGVLRGLHFQLPPRAQGKLVRVIAGAVFDVAVDIRRSSETHGHWFGIELTAVNRKQLWLPPGFAHGFLTVSEWAEVLYKTTDYYAPDFDRTVRWDDPDIGIEWPIDGAPILSEKDAAAPLLRHAEVFS
jgi:dTDP-4-dehydrorhamnose 3,5-epimerase